MAEVVREIMDAEPARVGADTDVESVIRLLREHELPGVPVVDDQGECIGIVTESDLVIPDEEGDLHLPHYLSLFGGLIFLESLGRFEDRLRKAFGSTAREVMTADPTTIWPGASVREAAHLISESGHNRLPVVEGRRLVGVVTRVDVLQALAS